MSWSHDIWSRAEKEAYKIGIAKGRKEHSAEMADAMARVYEQGKADAMVTYASGYHTNTVDHAEVPLMKPKPAKKSAKAKEKNMGVHEHDAGTKTEILIEAVKALTAEVRRATDLREAGIAVALDALKKRDVKATVTGVLNSDDLKRLKDAAALPAWYKV